jgi:AraC family transcriptional activator of pobA
MQRALCEAGESSQTKAKEIIVKKIPLRQITENLKQASSTERFKIRSVQEILLGNTLKQDLHRHDFFFILLLQKGNGIHEIDFKEYEVLDNSVFFLRPGQVHQLELNSNCTGYLMEFNEEFYHPKDKSSSQRFRKASNKNFCLLEITRFDKLSQVSKHISQEYTSKEAGYLDSVKANLEIFFIELVRQSPNPNSISPDASAYVQERFEEFLELLQRHIITNKVVSDYSNMMSLSLYQLNKITKTSIGKTPSDLINEQLILEAKRYLLATPNQIKDIADHLGYEDVSYFIRFFKKNTGHSPEAFRHNLR